MSELKPRRVGAPSRISDEVIDRIVTAVRGGSYLDDASAYAGISYRTLCRWVERGKRVDIDLEAGNDVTDEDRQYWQFWHELQRARAAAVIRNVATIQRAADEGTWQAAAWYLERTNPKKWGRYETVEIDGSDSGTDARAQAMSVLDERINRMRERASMVIEVTGQPETDPTDVVIDLPSDEPELRIAR